MLLFLGARHATEAKRNSLKIAVAFPVVSWLDWVLVGVAVALVGVLKEYGVADTVVFLILWLGNMLVSGSIVYIGRKTQTDLTLMEGLRRLVDKTTEKTRTTGILLEVFLFFRLLLWDGADQFIVFFDRRLKSTGAKIAVFVAASGIQMAIWTVLFIKGYESLTELFF